MLQMFWAIGAIIVGGVTYYYNDLESDLAYRCAALRYRCDSCRGERRTNGEYQSPHRAAMDVPDPSRHLDMACPRVALVADS
jgi:hypothetical protein